MTAAWGSSAVLDPTVAVAMLDRLLHKSVVLQFDGESYRMRATTPPPRRCEKAVVPA